MSRYNRSLTQAFHRHPFDDSLDLYNMMKCLLLPQWNDGEAAKLLRDRVQFKINIEKARLLSYDREATQKLMALVRCPISAFSIERGSEGGA